jgi:hypothetical protein
MIINFEELKRKVDDKMHQFNIIERSKNKGKPGHFSRLSVGGNSNFGQVANMVNQTQIGRGASGSLLSKDPLS